MNCEHIQSLLSRSILGELSPQERELVNAHVGDCLSCREALSFEMGLSRQLDSDVVVPSTLESRIRSRIEAAPARSAWLAQLSGRITMKKVLVSASAVTSLVLATSLLIPSAARASSPLETFKSIRMNLMRRAASGALKFVVTASNEGTVEAKGSLDGQPLPAEFPVDVHVQRNSDDTLQVGLEIDFPAEGFASFKQATDEKDLLFKDGSNVLKNTIVVAPKGNPNVKYLLTSDPTTHSLTKWTTLARQDGKWSARSSFGFKPSLAQSLPTADKVRATILMRLGQTAEVVINQR